MTDKPSDGLIRRIPVAGGPGCSHTNFPVSSRSEGVDDPRNYDILACSMNQGFCLYPYSYYT